MYLWRFLINTLLASARKLPYMLPDYPRKDAVNSNHITGIRPAYLTFHFITKYFFTLFFKNLKSENYAWKTL